MRRRRHRGRRLGGRYYTSTNPTGNGTAKAGEYVTDRINLGYSSIEEWTKDHINIDDTHPNSTGANMALADYKVQLSSTANSTASNNNYFCETITTTGVISPTTTYITPAFTIVVQKELNIKETGGAGQLVREINNLLLTLLPKTAKYTVQKMENKDQIVINFDLSALKTDDEKERVIVIEDE